MYIYIFYFGNSSNGNHNCYISIYPQALILMQHANLHSRFNGIHSKYRSIAYDPRNKFHYCMSKFLQVRS